MSLASAAPDLRTNRRPPRHLAAPSYCHLAELDPRLGPDDACAACGKPRNAAARRHSDPFCSAACCRAWHGVESSFPPGEGVFSQRAAGVGSR